MNATRSCPRSDDSRKPKYAAEGVVNRAGGDPSVPSREEQVVVRHGQLTTCIEVAIELESPGFARNFGSCGEVEGLHLVGVLTFGDEFREDVGLVGIQQKFRKALA